MIRSNYIRRGVLALCMLIMTMAAWAQHDSDSLKNDFSKHHQQDNYRKNLHGDKLKQTQHLGEGVPTLAEFKGYTLATVANLTYHLGDQHFFTLNDTYTHYRRRTTNAASNSVQSSAATFMRRINAKNTLGLSYERTYRLPTDRELFGDGDYEDGNATLRPEKSDNVNLNLSYQHTFNDANTLSADAGFNYRHVADYIIRAIGQKGVAVSTNHGKVLGMGMDLGLHYYYKDVASIGGNFSMQNTRNRERLNSIGAESVTYGDRVPNLPYTFGGADASYTFKHVLGKANRLTIGWNMRYVHRFFRSWASEGAKLYVPEQWSHDAIGMVYQQQFAGLGYGL